MVRKDFICKSKKVSNEKMTNIQVFMSHFWGSWFGLSLLYLCNVFYRPWIQCLQWWQWRDWNYQNREHDASHAPCDRPHLLLLLLPLQLRFVGDFDIDIGHGSMGLGSWSKHFLTFLDAIASLDLGYERE